MASPPPAHFPPWLAGVILNVLGSVSINLGTNLMKLGHSDKDKAAREVAHTLLKGATTPVHDLSETDRPLQVSTSRPWSFFCMGSTRGHVSGGLDGRQGEDSLSRLLTSVLLAHRLVRPQQQPSTFIAIVAHYPP